MPKFLLRFCLLLLPVISLAQVPEFKQESIIGTPLYSPTDMAVDAQGYMYVLEDDPYFSVKYGVVHKLDAQGRFVERINVSKPNYTRPYNCEGSALALDRAGNIYIADTGAGEIRKFSPTGQLLLTFRDTHWQPCYLFNPKNLTVDATGNIYVTDDKRVQKFNAQGTLQWAYELPVSNEPHRVMDIVTDAAGNAYFLSPEFTIFKLSPAGQLLQSVSVNRAGQYYLGTSNSGTLALDAAGNFYVGRGGGSPIYKFDAAGTFLLSMGPDITGEKLSLTFDSQGVLYAAAAGNRGWGAIVHKFDTSGREIRRWGERAEYRFITQNSEGEYFVFDLISQQIIKHAADGKELLRFGGTGYGNGTFESANGTGDKMTGLAVDADGNVYTAENRSNNVMLQKFDGQGRFLKTIYSNAFQNARLSGIAVDATGNLYVTDTNLHRVLKINQQGQLLLTLGSEGPGRGKFSKPQGVATDGLGFLYVSDSTGIRIRQFSPAGQLLRQILVPRRAGSFSYSLNPAALSVDQQGTMFVSHTEWDSVRVIDRSGRFQRAIANDFGTVDGISINREGSRLLTLHASPKMVISYANSVSPPQLQSRIQGRLFQDQNQDCQFQTTELALANMAVVAEPGNYYGMSDENGIYTIAADTGRYTVRQLLAHEPGRVIQQTCVPAQSVHLAAYGTTLKGPDFGSQVALTPYLSVQVASNRRRRCFRNVTTVAYANTGYAASAQAKVMVALPEHVLFISANVPYTRDASGTYVFDVGTLAPNQHGTITIQDSVACGDPSIRGLTVCTQAWITPANSYPAPTIWNKASIAVRGKRQPGNLARFTVTNTGQSATTDSLSLRVFQDTQLALVHRFALAAADSLVLRVPATGRVVRVEADQPAGHPLKTMASSNVELPGGAASGTSSTAMSAFPIDDNEPEKAVDCQPIVDSFDPNDKQVVPAGLTTQRYTPTNTPLRYQIRFQNTGTDVAYRVVVVDTLAADLDLSTLQVGASSHPYRLSITGKTRPVLTFRFDNIMLPDSSHDQLGSNGFVQFSIQPTANLAPRTSIENYADIFFDFNEPVRTNTTLNRIYDMPRTVVPAQQLVAQNIIVSPSIRSFLPAAGRPGTQVTLTGQQFSPDPARNRVLFQGVAAPVLRATSTTLTVQVPAGAVTSAIRVITPDGAVLSGTSFTVFQQPTLTSLSAEEGIPGGTITLTGTNFSAVAAQDTITFGGVPARVLQASATSLQVEVPQGAPLLGRIVVKTLGGQVASTQLFRLWYPPTVVAFNPGKGKAGSIIALTGTNFAETAARNAVRFGTIPATVVEASASRLLVRVPAQAQSGTLQVQTPGGSAVSATAFAFIPAPVVTGFTPAEGPSGTLVTITGQDFLREGTTDTVYFHGIPAAVRSASPTQLVVEVPKGVSTGVVSVAGAGGKGLSSLEFVVPALSPSDAIDAYPNPATTHVTVGWRKADFAVQHVQVFNALGSMIFEQDVQLIPTDSITIDLTPTRSGLYLVVLHTAKGTITKRLTRL